MQNESQKPVFKIPKIQSKDKPNMNGKTQHLGASSEANDLLFVNNEVFQSKQFSPPRQSHKRKLIDYSDVMADEPMEVSNRLRWNRSNFGCDALGVYSTTKKFKSSSKPKVFLLILHLTLMYIIFI